jgi:hypothetical protein
MNTPDAGRIRVRWYEVPRVEGVHTLDEYSSSDWDDDPKSYDPEFGEESTTRNPFADWRPCVLSACVLGECHLFVDPPYQTYAFWIPPGTFPVGWTSLEGLWTFVYDGPCSWACLTFGNALPAPNGFGLGEIYPGLLSFDAWWQIWPILSAEIDFTVVSPIPAESFPVSVTLSRGFLPPVIVGVTMYAVCENPIMTEDGRHLLTEDGSRLTCE